MPVHADLLSSFLRRGDPRLRRWEETPLQFSKFTIDTAPHSESSALAAARSADLVIVPCRPAIFDLRAIRATADLIKLADAQACVVINATQARGTRADEAALAIASYNLTVLPARLGNRTAFNDSVTMGKTAQEYEPTGKAAMEIKEVYKSICQFVEL